MYRWKIGADGPGIEAVFGHEDERVRAVVLDVKERKRLAVMDQLEAEARANGFSRIAGVDEAGRGPLAGPIVAGAVILASPLPGLDDSKRLSEEAREYLFAQVRSGDHEVGVAVIEAEEIDRIGIQAANYRVMAMAVMNLPAPPDFVLVDGFRIPGVLWPHARVIKGDQRSMSIAAASIVAKVTRDRLMGALDEQCPGYGFAQHKGYGTQAHLDALARLGPCSAHRRSFAPLSKREIDDLFA